MTLPAPAMAQFSDAYNFLKAVKDRDGEKAWQALVEEPLGEVIERLISNDLVRGLVFTDGK